jgi:hypothetical protein
MHARPRRLKKKLKKKGLAGQKRSYAATNP